MSCLFGLSDFWKCMSLGPGEPALLWARSLQCEARAPIPASVHLAAVQCGLWAASVYWKDHQMGVCSPAAGSPACEMSLLHSRHN